MGGKGMSQGMAARRFGEPRFQVFQRLQGKSLGFKGGKGGHILIFDFRRIYY